LPKPIRSQKPPKAQRRRSKSLPTSRRGREIPSSALILNHHLKIVTQQQLPKNGSAATQNFILKLLQHPEKFLLLKHGTIFDLPKCCNHKILLKKLNNEKRDKFITTISVMQQRLLSIFFCCSLLLIAAQTNAQNYRSAGTGNWNVAGTWQVESPAGSGNWIGASSFPNTTNDTVLIRNGHTVTINTSPITIRRLVVGEGTSGVLQFDNTSGRTLTVGAGGVAIASGGQFNASGTPQDNGNDTHTLTIQNGGSLTNNGTISFRIPDGASFFDIVNINLSGNLAGTGTSTFNNIQFNGTTNQTITIGGTVAINGTVATTVQFNNTGTAPNNQIINQSVAFTNAISVTPDRTTFTQGNYVHDVNATYLVSNASITIPTAMTVTALQGTMNFAHDNASAPALTLNGNLVIDGGTVNAGVNTNTTNQLANSLNMNAANASITLNSGQLNVGNTTTGFGNLRMSADNQSVTVNGGTLRTERWVIGSGNADNQTVTINGGLVQILPTVTTTDRVALQFVQGTLVMNGGQMRIGENLTAITGSNLEPFFI
jgi:hypothetical protein